MPFCPNCGGFSSVNKKKTSWRCKRSCGVGGSLNPNYDIESQMRAQFPQPELKYPESNRNRGQNIHGSKPAS